MRTHERGRLFQLIELAANLSIVGVALVLMAVLLGWWTAGSQAPHGLPQSIRVGDSLQLPGAGAPGKATLVLALSAECRFCTESMPFYRRLAAQARDAKVELLALMPQEPSVAVHYLTENGLIDGIGSVERLDHSVPVPAVPAIIAVGADGIVRDMWLGRLDIAREREVLGRLDQMSRRSAIAR